MNGAEKMIEALNSVALEKSCFEYLDAVRDMGIINMFGATPYLEEEFGLNKREAQDILVKWMQTFAERHPQE